MLHNGQLTAPKRRVQRQIRRLRTLILVIDEMFETHERIHSGP